MMTLLSRLIALATVPPIAVTPEVGIQVRPPPL